MAQITDQQVKSIKEEEKKLPTSCQIRIPHEPFCFIIKNCIPDDEYPYFSNETVAFPVSVDLHDKEKWRVKYASSKEGPNQTQLPWTQLPWKLDLVYLKMRQCVQVGMALASLLPTPTGDELHTVSMPYANLMDALWFTYFQGMERFKLAVVKHENHFVKGKPNSKRADAIMKVVIGRHKQVTKETRKVWIEDETQQTGLKESEEVVERVKYFVERGFVFLIEFKREDKYFELKNNTQDTYQRHKRYMSQRLQEWNDNNPDMPALQGILINVPKCQDTRIEYRYYTYNKEKNSTWYTRNQNTTSIARFDKEDFKILWEAFTFASQHKEVRSWTEALEKGLRDHESARNGTDLFKKYVQDEFLGAIQNQNVVVNDNHDDEVADSLQIDTAQETQEVSQGGNDWINPSVDMGQWQAEMWRCNDIYQGEKGGFQTLSIQIAFKVNSKENPVWVKASTLWDTKEQYLDWSTKVIEQIKNFAFPDTELTVDKKQECKRNKALRDNKDEMGEWFQVKLKRLSGWVIMHVDALREDLWKNWCNLGICKCDEIILTEKTGDHVKLDMIWTKLYRQQKRRPRYDEKYTKSTQISLENLDNLKKNPECQWFQKLYAHAEGIFNDQYMHPAAQQGDAFMGDESESEEGIERDVDVDVAPAWWMQVLRHLHERATLYAHIQGKSPSHLQAAFMLENVKTWRHQNEDHPPVDVMSNLPLYLLVILVQISKPLSEHPPSSSNEKVRAKEVLKFFNDDCQLRGNWKTTILMTFCTNHDELVEDCEQLVVDWESFESSNIDMQNLILPLKKWFAKKTKQE